MDGDSGCGSGWTGVPHHSRFYGETDEAYALRLGEKVCAIRQGVLSCVAVRLAAERGDAATVDRLTHVPATLPAPLTPSEPTDLDLWREGHPVARALYGSRGPPGAWDESELWAERQVDESAEYDDYDDDYDGISYALW